MECKIIFQVICIFITGYFVGRMAQSLRHMKKMRDEIFSLMGRFEVQLQELRDKNGLSD